MFYTEYSPNLNAVCSRLDFSHRGAVKTQLAQQCRQEVLPVTIPEQRRAHIQGFSDPRSLEAVGRRAEHPALERHQAGMAPQDRVSPPTLQIHTCSLCTFRHQVCWTVYQLRCPAAMQQLHEMKLCTGGRSMQWRTLCQPYLGDVL